MYIQCIYRWCICIICSWNFSRCTKGTCLPSPYAYMTSDDIATQKTWDINIEISIVMLVLSPFIPTYHKGEALAWSRLASAGRGALYSTTAGLRSPWQFLRRRLQELQKSVSVRRLRPWCALGFFSVRSHLKRYVWSWIAKNAIRFAVAVWKSSLRQVFFLPSRSWVRGSDTCLQDHESTRGRNCSFRMIDETKWKREFPNFPAWRRGVYSIHWLKYFEYRNYHKSIYWHCQFQIQKILSRTFRI